MQGWLKRKQRGEMEQVRGGGRQQVFQDQLTGLSPLVGQETLRLIISLICCSHDFGA